MSDTLTENEGGRSIADDEMQDGRNGGNHAVGNASEDSGSAEEETIDCADENHDEIQSNVEATIDDNGDDDGIEEEEEEQTAGSDRREADEADQAGEKSADLETDENENIVADQTNAASCSVGQLHDEQAAAIPITVADDMIIVEATPLIEVVAVPFIMADDEMMQRTNAAVRQRQDQDQTAQHDHENAARASEMVAYASTIDDNCSQDDERATQSIDKYGASVPDTMAHSAPEPWDERGHAEAGIATTRSDLESAEPASPSRGSASAANPSVTSQRENDSDSPASNPHSLRSTGEQEIRLSMLQHHQFQQVDIDEEGASQHGDGAFVPANENGSHDGSDGSSNGRRKNADDGQGSNGQSPCSCSGGFFLHFLLVFLTIAAYTLLLFVIFGVMIDIDRRYYPADTADSDDGDEQINVVDTPIPSCWHEVEQMRLHLQKLRAKALIACFTATAIVTIHSHLCLGAFLHPEQQQSGSYQRTSRGTASASNQKLPHHLLQMLLLELAWFFTNATTLICVGMYGKTPDDDMIRVCEDEQEDRFQIHAESNATALADNDGSIATTTATTKDGLTLDEILDFVAGHQIDLSAYDTVTLVTLIPVVFFFSFHAIQVYSTTFGLLHEEHGLEAGNTSNDNDGDSDSNSNSHNSETSLVRRGRERFRIISTAVIPVAATVALILQWVALSPILYNEIDALDDFKAAMGF